MNLTYLIVGLLFLANPNINVYDPLPDAIGYLFILYGLRRLADCYPVMNDSRKIFRTLLFISVLKMAAAALCSTVITDQGYKLVFSFAFGLFEAVYTVAAFGKLFDSMLYFGTRYEGTAIFQGIAETKTITAIFMTARAVIPFLPELTFLSTSAVDEGTVNDYAGPVDFGHYRTMFTAAAILLTLVLTVIWLVMILRYFIRVKRDVTFVKNVTAYYNEVVAPDTDLFTRRRLTCCCSLLIIGALAVFNIYSDGTNLLPTAILGVLWCVAFGLMLKYCRLAWIPMIPAALFSLADLALWLANDAMPDRYYNSSTQEPSLALLTPVIVCALLGALALFVTVLASAFVLLRVIDTHTGVVSIRADDSLTAEKNRQTKRSLRVQLWLTVGTAAVAAVSYAGQAILLYSVEGFAFMLVPILVGVLFFVTAFAFFSMLSEQILTRYFG